MFSPPGPTRCFKMQDTGIFFFSVFSRERREKTWLRSANLQKGKKKSYEGRRCWECTHRWFIHVEAREQKPWVFFFLTIFFLFIPPPLLRSPLGTFLWFWKPDAESVQFSSAVWAWEVAAVLLLGCRPAGGLCTRPGIRSPHRQGGVAGGCWSLSCGVLTSAQTTLAGPKFLL